MSPVRAGLVERAEDWPWSSVREGTCARWPAHIPSCALIAYCCPPMRGHASKRTAAESQHRGLSLPANGGSIRRL
jgi:hypothetical protein